MTNFTVDTIILNWIKSDSYSFDSSIEGSSCKSYSASTNFADFIESTIIMVKSTTIAINID